MFGDRAGHQRRPAALDGDVRARVAAGAQHGGDLVARMPGRTSALAVPAVAAGVVDAAAGQHVGVGADVGGADDRGEPVGQRFGHPVGVSHGASDRNAPSSISRSGVDGR